MEDDWTPADEPEGAAWWNSRRPWVYYQDGRVVIGNPSSLHKHIPGYERDSGEYEGEIHNGVVGDTRAPLPVTQLVQHQYDVHYRPKDEAAGLLTPQLPEQHLAGWDDDDFAPTDVGEEHIWKWVWNQQDGVLLQFTDDKGKPTHGEMIASSWSRPQGPQDYLGIANPSESNPLGIEIEGYRPETPKVALAAVKEALAAQNPSSQIIMPETHEDLGVEFHPNLARHDAAAAWATANL